MKITYIETRQAPQIEVEIEATRALKAQLIGLESDLRELAAQNEHHTASLAQKSAEISKLRHDAAVLRLLKDKKGATAAESQATALEAEVQEHYSALDSLREPLLLHREAVARLKTNLQAAEDAAIDEIKSQLRRELAEAAAEVAQALQATQEPVNRAVTVLANLLRLRPGLQITPEPSAIRGLGAAAATLNDFLLLCELRAKS